MLQLTEFAEKNKTNFVRNVRPRLQRSFPSLYHGKEGNQKLLRDVRYLKIACDGKIPPITANDGENLEKLVRKGRNKVKENTGLNPESDNFLKPAQQHDSLSLPPKEYEHISQADAYKHPAPAVCTDTATTTIQNQNIQPWPLPNNNFTAGGVSAATYPLHPYYFPFDIRNVMQPNIYPFMQAQPQNQAIFSNTLYPTPVSQEVHGNVPEYHTNNPDNALNEVHQFHQLNTTHCIDASQQDNTSSGSFPNAEANVNQNPTLLELANVSLRKQ